MKSKKERYVRFYIHIELKKLRASGGCLGDKRRRRTWHSAKSRGEMRAIFDPRVSEWGNPPFLRDRYLNT